MTFFDEFDDKIVIVEVIKAGIPHENGVNGKMRFSWWELLGSNEERAIFENAEIE